MYEKEVQDGFVYLTFRGYSLTGIDIDALNLRNFQECVLGQLFGSYSMGVQDLGITPEEAEEYGFVIEPREYMNCRVEEYEALTAAWKNLLTSKSQQSALITKELPKRIEMYCTENEVNLDLYQVTVDVEAKMYQELPQSVQAIVRLADFLNVWDVYVESAREKHYEKVENVAKSMLAKKAPFYRIKGADHPVVEMFGELSIPNRAMDFKWPNIDYKWPNIWREVFNRYAAIYDIYQNMEIGKYRLATDLLRDIPHADAAIALEGIAKHPRHVLYTVTGKIRGVSRKTYASLYNGVVYVYFNNDIVDRFPMSSGIHRGEEVNGWTFYFSPYDSMLRYLLFDVNGKLAYHDKGTLIFSDEDHDVEYAIHPGVQVMDMLETNKACLVGIESATYGSTIYTIQRPLFYYI